MNMPFDSAQFGRDLVIEIRNYVDRVVAPLEERIKQLGTREQNLKYCGVWEAQQEYKAGNFTTYGGALWCCIAEQTTQKPGDGPQWQLAVRKGRDLRLDAASR